MVRGSGSAPLVCPACGGTLQPDARRVRYTCTTPGCDYSLIWHLLWEEGDDLDDDHLGAADDLGKR